MGIRPPSITFSHAMIGPELDQLPIMGNEWSFP